MVATLTNRMKSRLLVDLKFAQSELLSLQSLRQTLQKQHELQQLREATGMDDQHMLERLYDAGFHAQNVHALTWLPIALVAWASQGVSRDEAEATKLVNLCSVLTGNVQSTRQFQVWLTERPSEKLSRLWEDYVRLQTAEPDEECQQTGQAVLYIARKVAEASGGIFGLGQISTAEQRVLDRIRSAYGLAMNP